MDVTNSIKKFLRKNGKVYFISRLKRNSSILDVGCGNNSPFNTKKILPSCKYTGIDIGDYNQTKPLLADAYILTTAEKFSKELSSFAEEFDAVISSHNLEHCDNRLLTLQAMLKALKVGGHLYLSFPCEQSTRFPKRRGTLNYYDDETHKFSPPNFDEVMTIIRSYGFEIEYAERNYSPMILRLIGFIFEPLSKLKNKTMIGSWEYYGFESIIIARRLK